MSRAKADSAPTAPGLYLELHAGAGAAQRLAAALSAAPVAAILVRSASSGGAAAADVRALAALAQAQGVAVLVADDVELARKSDADGVHLDWSEDIEARYREVRRALGPRQIVGCMAGLLRHDAMALGEAGADYIGFGGPGVSPEERLELVDWWAEIFEVPCVAFGVADAGAAHELAAAGADFVGVALDATAPPAAALDLVGAVRAAVESGVRDRDRQTMGEHR